MSGDRSKPRSRFAEGTPLFLVGFMGAGKTEVGKLVASKLGYRFVDLDRLIEGRAGNSISEIFGKQGEPAFRRMETDEIASLTGLRSIVVALGGGAYQAKENRLLVREMGLTVWLNCPFDVCFERVKDDAARPLVAGEEEMREVFNKRLEAYSLADWTIETRDLSADEIAARIQSYFK